MVAFQRREVSGCASQELLICSVCSLLLTAPVVLRMSVSALALRPCCSNPCFHYLPESVPRQPGFYGGRCLFSFRFTGLIQCPGVSLVSSVVVSSGFSRFLVTRVESRCHHITGESPRRYAYIFGKT